MIRKVLDGNNQHCETTLSVLHEGCSVVLHLKTNESAVKGRFDPKELLIYLAENCGLPSKLTEDFLYLLKKEN